MTKLPLAGVAAAVLALFAGAACARRRQGRDRRLATQKIPEGDYGLGIHDWGAGWIGHTGQIIGWESLVAYNMKTGAAFVAIVNETGSFMSALDVGLQVFPDLNGLLERRRNPDSPAEASLVKTLGSLAAR